MGFTCNGPCQQRLTCSGRSHQKGALGKVCANVRILLGVVQEIHDLLQRILGLLLARHICKCDPCFIFSINLCIGLSKSHGIVAAHALAHHASHDLSYDHKHQDGRHP